MQVAPDIVEPEGDRFNHLGEKIVTADVDFDRESIGTLLDKRSDLMKRGRVKRVFYQVTEEVHTNDMRTAFADLEELEDKEATSEVNRCAQT